MSSRFFVPPEQIRPPTFTILGSEARHAALVLRKKVGDEIELFDGKDLSFHGRIQTITSERIEGLILGQPSSAKSSLAPLVLYQALIKGPRWDWLVEKICEVGATRLVPMTTARTVVKPTHTAGVERWQRIALAACKQSGRSQGMDIGTPVSFPEALDTLPDKGLAFIPWEKETRATLRQSIAPQQPIALFIGPEGGWETSEVDLARRRGVIPVTIGTTLLRAETAALVALAQVQYERGF